MAGISSSESDVLGDGFGPGVELYLELADRSIGLLRNYRLSGRLVSSKTFPSALIPSY
jgi:hypothetical protein